MKAEIKNLLNEMIGYSNEPGRERGWNYLNEAIKINNEGLYYLTNKLINWLDPFFLQLPDFDNDKIKLRGDQGIDYDSLINEMSQFFKYCPELENIFTLKDEVIYFNSKLSLEEQKEIRQFVDENRQSKVTNFYIPVKKRKRGN